MINKKIVLFLILLIIILVLYFCRFLSKNGYCLDRDSNCVNHDQCCNNKCINKKCII